MDHISVVTVNYNTSADTIECLTSLAAVKTKGFTFSVVVLDNGSREPLTLPKSLQQTFIEVLRSESNLGYTGGNNLAIRHALDTYNSDYILLLNNDTYVDPDFLSRLYQHALVSPQDGLVTPKIYFAKGREFFPDSYSAAEKGNIIWYGGGSIDWGNLLAFHRSVDEVDRGQLATTSDSDFATGCCVLIRREVLEKIGLLSEDYFLYLEDVDLSIRARLAGYGLGFCSTAVVWHKNAGSSGGAGSELHQYYMTRNRLYFCLKNGTTRVRLTVVRYALQLLLSGTRIERVAVLDLLQGKLGKRVTI